MTKDLWLPKGYLLPDGSKIQELLHFNTLWQIFATSGSSNILLVQSQLAQKWIDVGFIEEELFEDVSLGHQKFKFLGSHKNYILSPIECTHSFVCMEDALAFAYALKSSRTYLTKFRYMMPFMLNNILNCYRHGTPPINYQIALCLENGLQAV